VAAPAPPPEPAVAFADAPLAPSPPKAEGLACAPARAGPAPRPSRLSATLALRPPMPRLALAPPPAPRSEPPDARGAAAPAAAPAAAEAPPPAASAPVTAAVPAAGARPHAPASAGAARALSGVGRTGPRHANPTWPSRDAPPPAPQPGPSPRAAPAPAPASPPATAEPSKAPGLARAPAAAPLPRAALETPVPPLAPLRVRADPPERVLPAPDASPTPPAQPTRAEAPARPVVPREQPAEPTRGRPADTRARPLEAGPASEAVARRLLGPLPVPVFSPRRTEPAPPSADLPIWQETPAPRPGPARATWTPGRPLDLRLILKRVLKLGALGTLGFVLTLAGLIVLYRWVNPPTSMLMLGQRLGGNSISQQWVSLEHIASNLQLAVIASEDGRFCHHHGVDWEELESAIDQSVDGAARGGSTIAMQTVKNLFLWPAKSYLRKAMEIPLAYAVAAIWSKRRLLEIYLNIAEWGPGVFGAEAAARYHFRKPASLLSAREAALLAVSLPNPFERRAGAPGPGTQRLAANLMLRMRTAPGMARCVRAGSGP
jgi:monofunctional glycosyltransferase